jgi:hypothetical protein
MPLDRLWRFLDDVLLRRGRRGRRLTRRDRRLGLGWRRLGRRGLRRRGLRRRFDRNDRRLGRGWNWLRFRRRRRGFGRRRRFGFWRRRFKSHLDPAFRNRFPQRRGLAGEEQHQQRQANRVPGQRQCQRNLDAAHFGLAASATRDTFENPA